jgi:hypothetical protein
MQGGFILFPVGGDSGDGSAQRFGDVTLELREGLRTTTGSQIVRAYRPTDGQVSQCGHNLCAVGIADATAVFVKAPTNV